MGFESALPDKSVIAFVAATVYSDAEINAEDGVKMPIVLLLVRRILPATLVQDAGGTPAVQI